MHSQLRLVAARNALGIAEMDEMIDAAHAALDAGIYSYSLGEVASQSEPNVVDTMRWFAAATQELGIKSQDKADCVEVLIHDAQYRLIEGDGSPIEIFNRMRLNSWTLTHIEELQIWNGRYWQLREIHDLHEAGYCDDPVAEESKILQTVYKEVWESCRQRWQSVVRSEWRTSAVLGIAGAIHADAAFDRLPILADALQDAGCEHDELLGHLREGGRHEKCCWVVELLLDAW